MIVARAFSPASRRDGRDCSRDDASSSRGEGRIDGHLIFRKMWSCWKVCDKRARHLWRRMLGRRRREIHPLCATRFPHIRSFRERRGEEKVGLGRQSCFYTLNFPTEFGMESMRALCFLGLNARDVNASNFESLFFACSRGAAPVIISRTERVPSFD